ncbi:MAG: hypothetical protein ACK5L5_10730 [Bacteroidales bacterium]
MDIYILKFTLASVAFLLSISTSASMILSVKTNKTSATDTFLRSCRTNPQAFDAANKKDTDIPLPSQVLDNNSCVIIENFENKKS